MALPRPILDLGCGDGLFARLAGWLDGAVGLDLSSREVSRARSQGVYAHVIQADAARLPFAPESFGTVVSISTLEHLPRLTEVLDEVVRVLRPGGRLVFSVPGPEFAASLFWSRVLRAIRWEGAAQRYAACINRVFRHRNLLTLEEWGALLEAHGFAVLEVHRFNPPGWVALQDLGYPISALVSCLRRATGRWVLGGPWRKVIARILTAVVTPDPTPPAAAGTCYFFCVEARTDGPR